MGRRRGLGAVVRYSLDLPVDLYNSLRDIASNKKVDLSTLIRLALRDYINSYEKEIIRASIPEREEEEAPEEQVPEKPEEYKGVEVEMLKDLPPYNRGARLMVAPETAVKWEQIGVARRVGS